jgi:hypothetical protein
MPLAPSSRSLASWDQTVGAAILEGIRVNPDAFRAEIRVQTGLIPIDWGTHRRQP